MRFNKRLCLLMMIFFCIEAKSAPASVGLIIDDVSGDLTCHENVCQSTALNLMQRGMLASQAADKIKTRTLYILPDFASFVDFNARDNPNYPIAFDCPSKNITNFSINYQSLGLIKTSVVPSAKILIGGCVPADMVITSYRNQAKTLGFSAVKIIPMFSGSNSAISAKTRGEKAALTTTANRLSRLINGDAGVQAADGVAFDIEGPGFDNVSIANLIKPLATSLKDKPVLIFDFPFSSWDVSSMPLPKNIIAMAALYDYGMSPDSKNFPFQPLTVNTYKTQTTGVVAGYSVDLKKNIGVFFVLSGAASTELWQSYLLFNKSACHSCALSHINVGSGTGVVQNTNCYLTDTEVPNALTPLFKTFLEGEVSFSAFKRDCAIWQNQNVNSMSDYITAGMSAFYSIEMTSNFSQNFKGFILYNHKAQGFYAINAMKTAPNNAYGMRVKAEPGFYPEYIDVSTWQAFFQGLK